MTWATSELMRAHAAADGPGWSIGTGEAEERVPFSDALSRMTHEIRTPLNAVIGFAALMQRELHGALGSDRYREYVGHIAECGSRLLYATEQALLLAAATSGPHRGLAEQVSLREVVALALKTAAGRLDALGGAQVAIDPDCAVTVDANATRFAIANLIAVARRQGDAGGMVGLTSRVECGMLALDVTGSGSGQRAPTSGSQGHLAIARRLLEMQGLDLVTGCRNDDPWSARIVFADTAQLQLL